jgi:hypothetical protein
MYKWFWDKLPGNVPVKIVICLILVFVVICVLFKGVFPWAIHTFPPPFGYNYELQEI